MSQPDPGINKRFDRILKAFAEEAPELFLRLIHRIPAGAAADIRPLRPETAPSVVLPDYVARVRTGDRESIFHAEFQLYYHPGVARDMARYGGSLAWQYQLPVESILLLLQPDGVPEQIPKLGRYSIGETHTTHPFSVTRLWEMDPSPVLETGNPRLLPWALLMKSSDAHVREIASILARQSDEEATARFLILGGVRYDRSSLLELLQGGKMSLIQAIIEGSSIFKEERAVARTEGLAEGRLEGRLEGRAQAQTEAARRFLRFLLRKNHPELEDLPEIDQISDSVTLESLHELALDANAGETLRQAILSAARSHS